MIWNYHIAHIPPYFANMNAVQWPGRLAPRDRKDNNHEQKTQEDYKPTTRPRKKHKENTKKTRKNTKKTRKKHENTQKHEVNTKKHEMNTKKVRNKH